MKYDMKIPPNDINAESGVICTLIMHPEFELQSDHLQPNFFYYPENGEIYKAIKTLVLKGVSTIDELTLITQLTMSCDTDKMFYGEAKDKIKQLVDGAVHVSRNSIEEYKILVNTIIGLGFKRYAISQMQQVINKCHEAKIDDIDDINCELMDMVNNLATDFITRDKIDSFGKKIDNIWEDIKSKRNADGSYGIIPRWKCLQKYFTYQEGELILYVARRKQGKSVIGMNECLDKAERGLWVVYLDTEMSDTLFFTRLASHKTGIPENKIKSGELSSEEEEKLNKAIEYIKSLPIIHEYNPRWTRESIVTTAKILRNKGQCDFFIYDYIKATSGKTASASELSQELGIWCNTIKNDILGALGIAGISFAQLNRGLSIADSDGIERYCTAGVMWSKKTKEEIARDGEQCGNAKMKVLFNRIGDCHDEDDDEDYVDFLFRGNILSIYETKVQHEREDCPFDDESE